MTRYAVDPERLAALLEDRLDERERAELLAELAASDEDYEVFAEAVATTADLRAGEPLRDEAEDSESAEEADAVRPIRALDVDATPPPASVDAPPSESASAGVIPLRPRTSVWRRPAVRVVLAAVLAGVILIPAVRSRSALPGDAGEVTAMLESGTTLPPDWQPAWRVTRGEGDVVGGDQALAARIGARMAHLELAVRARDTLAARIAAGQVLSLLEDVSGGGIVASEIRQVEQLATQPGSDNTATLRQAQESVADFLGDRVVLGAWAESARLAAHYKNADFFRAAATPRILAVAGKDDTLPEEATAAIVQIQQELENGGELDFVLLGEQSFNLLRSIT